MADPSPDPEGSIDVNPSAVAFGNVDGFGQRIEGSGVDFTGLEHNDRRPVHFAEGRLQGSHPDPALIINRDQFDGIAAYTE